MIISELNYMSSPSGEIPIWIPQVSIDVTKICECSIYDLKSYLAPPTLSEVPLVHCVYTAALVVLAGECYMEHITLY